MSHRSHNKGGNTVISQSFIASQFQGFNDSFSHTTPTSALNQFVGSKPISNSGFFQQNENKSFGFSNISSEKQQSSKKQLQSKAQHQLHTSNPPQKINQYLQSNFTQQSFAKNFPTSPFQGQQIQNHYQSGNRPQNQINQLQNPGFVQQRYISPLILKQQSPAKRSSFVQQQPMVVQPFVNVNSRQIPSHVQKQFANIQRQQTMNVRPQQINSQSQQEQSTSMNEQPQKLIINSQQTLVSELSPQKTVNLVEKIEKLNEAKLEKLVTQQQKSILNKTTNSYSKEILQESNSMRRLKLNISQEFSNSFTLECVKQPQRSKIIEMKKRQREFRKSIQNFLV